MIRTRIVLAWGLLPLIGSTSCANPENPLDFKVIAVKPKIVSAPEWARRPCPRLLPVQKREGRLTLDDEKEWEADLKRYEECRLKQAALSNFVARRDSSLTGEDVTSKPKAKKLRKPVSKKTVPSKVKPRLRPTGEPTQ